MYSLFSVLLYYIWANIIINIASYLKIYRYFLNFFINMSLNNQTKITDFYNYDFLEISEK